MILVDSASHGASGVNQDSSVTSRKRSTLIARTDFIWEEFGKFVTDDDGGLFVRIWLMPSVGYMVGGPAIKVENVDIVTTHNIFFGTPESSFV